MSKKKKLVTKMAMNLFSDIISSTINSSINSFMEGQLCNTCGHKMTDHNILKVSQKQSIKIEIEFKYGKCTLCECEQFKGRED